MSLEILRVDALTTAASGFGLRLSLPWIRSLPVASLTGLEISIDDVPVSSVHVAIGNRLVDPVSLGDESAWWFIQDRVAVVGDLEDALVGQHEVRVGFALVIPYLQTGPDGPLSLPFEAGRPLIAGAPASAPTVSRDVV